MSEKSLPSRRDFLKTSAVAGAALSTFGTLKGVHAQENNVIRVGLVGAGGRGRGAATNALDADPNTKLTAICDAFEENAKNAANALSNNQNFKGRIDLDETTFWGLESYKQVIENCDVVLLCEPTHFRPISLKAAIDAGKHVFCEKPVAVDAPGIRSVLETAKKAKEKGLNLVSGLCWRYHPNVVDIMNRVKDGQVGDVSSVRVTYLTSRPWSRDRKAGDTEMMFQVRNWYNFGWLSGDYNTEQAVHSYDQLLWAFGDQPPVAAYGIGARMYYTDQPKWGDIFDSHSVVFEYPDGKTGYGLCRQHPNCFNENKTYITGSKGTAFLNGWGVSSINGENPYTQPKKSYDMYYLEHIELFNAIRSGGAKYINNGEYMSYSTMLGILAREVCYTGKRILWDDFMKSEESLSPTGYTWEDTPPAVPDENGRYKVSVPGMGKVYHTVTR